MSAAQLPATEDALVLPDSQLEYSIATDTTSTARSVPSGADTVRALYQLLSSDGRSHGTGTVSAAPRTAVMFQVLYHPHS
ncbi:hypothetical protein [Paenibacillus ihumii]|uniref:hypothetical protein n=1 Tax=Paenibacillus ihumii TaxID=687436 RepID=UPI001CA34AE6|nr:hypothetical protein [Paenibacillus ihumii]